MCYHALYRCRRVAEKLAKAAHAFRCGHGRRVAEVFFCSLDIEIVRSAELCGEKAGHARLSARAEHMVECFQKSADFPCEWQRDRTRDRRQTAERQNLVDPLPAVHGLALADEIRAAADRRAG